VITNLSSGKMGYALARACSEAGATVTLISGPTALAVPLDVIRIDVTRAADMLAAVAHNLAGADIFIGVAAVADYTVANPSATKHKKGDAPLRIELAPTVDILARVASGANPPFCVGFAAESDNVEVNAEAKRKNKGVPLLVANRAQDALGSETNAVTLLDSNGRHPLPAAPKLEIARQIVAHIAGMLAAPER
jgi:phosphopantothenoylcysteine decarboxylase/phosphopantothenate--cysteine ligase